LHIAEECGMKARKRAPRRGKRIGRRLWAAVAACGMLLLTLAGCAKGEAAIDVHANGSADVTLAIALPKEAEKVAGGLFERLEDQLLKQGFQASIRREDDGLSFQATRRYTREEFADRAVADGFTFDVTGLRLTYKRESGWLYDSHRLSGVFEPTELLSSDNTLMARYRALPALVRRLAENRVSLDFKLSLPIPVASHNAAVKEGRTLVWHLSPSKDTPVEVAIAAPNIRTFIAAGGAVLLLLVGTAWLIMRRRRLRTALIKE
jgi:hypothetical protein